MKTKHHPKHYWNLQKSLDYGRALTRDGRLVANLKVVTIDNGIKILIGQVSIKPLHQYKPNSTIRFQRMWWDDPNSAWGLTGDDDLMTITDKPILNENPNSNRIA